MDMTKYIDGKVAAIYELANNEDDVKKYIRCAIESAYIQGQKDTQSDIEHWKTIAADQKILIEGFKGECKDMGTTDICLALARKDTEIAELKEKLIETLLELTQERESISSKVEYEFLYQENKNLIAKLRIAVDFVSEAILEGTNSEERSVPKAVYRQLTDMDYDG